jgi:predicted DNA-binding protein with PD1-like motif
MGFARWFQDRQSGALVVSMGPGDLLLEGIRQAVSESGLHSGAIVSGLGSLTRASIALLGQNIDLQEKLEIMQFCGIIAAGEPHVHITLCNAQGRLFGGHLRENCAISTVAEIAIMPFASLRLVSRQRDGCGMKLLDRE